MSAKEAEKVRESAGNGAKNVRFDAGVGADEGFLQIRPKKSANRPIRGAEKVRSAASGGLKTGAKVRPDTGVCAGAGEGFRCWRSLKTSKIRPKSPRNGPKSPVGSSPKVRLDNGDSTGEGFLQKGRKSPIFL